MTKDIYKPRVLDLMEAIFDVCYLTFDLIAGILFLVFSKGNVLFILYGILTLTLCGGDAFHLIPRVIRALKGSNDKVKKQLGIGLQISSITMTIFYIILLYVWKYTFYEMEAPIILEIVIWVSAIIRIVICLLPQNNWCNAISGNTYGYHMTRMVTAIIISFGCYLPVTLLSKKMPKIGMLMIPKTCAYIWMIVMGLQLLF